MKLYYFIREFSEVACEWPEVHIFATPEDARAAMVAEVIEAQANLGGWIAANIDGDDITHTLRTATPYHREHLFSGSLYLHAKDGSGAVDCFKVGSQDVDGVAPSPVAVVIGETEPVQVDIESMSPAELREYDEARADENERKADILDALESRRYVAFFGGHFYPGGGGEDFCEGFATPELAEAYLKGRMADDPMAWGHVWDSFAHMILKRFNGREDKL